MHKITAYTLVYNEEKRISRFLRHAAKWADEVVVIDKSSTDKTREISEQMGVRVVTVPFSKAGQEDPNDFVSYLNTDWNWAFTAGEVPTRKLVESVRQMLSEKGDVFEIICVPKKMYSFGTHDTRSSWSISYQPFVFNRSKAKIARKIHANISGEGSLIPYAEDCYVLHPTHPNVESFFNSHMDYMRAEARDTNDAPHTIAFGLEMIRRFDFGIPQPGDPLFMHMCAWRFYYYGVMLACAEKSRGFTSDEFYKEMTEDMIRGEWGLA